MRDYRPDTHEHSDAHARSVPDKPDGDSCAVHAITREHSIRCVSAAVAIRTGYPGANH